MFDPDQSALEEAIDNGLLQMSLGDILSILVAALLYLGMLFYGIQLIP